MAATQTFNHFDPSVQAFLLELKKNNNKEWFSDNKPRYKNDVVGPMTDFITAMSTPLKGISKHYIADPRGNGGSMFRIYRDVRFSKDKTPYKEHVACQFRHEAGKDAHAPGFYIHLGTDEVIFGGGIWQPPADALYKIRDRIRTHPAEWKKVIEDKTLNATFDGIAGDGLSRPPKGFEKDLPYIEDIKRKSFFAMRHEEAGFAYQPGFFDEVVSTLNTTRPLMRFICKAMDLPF